MFQYSVSLDSKDLLSYCDGLTVGILINYTSGQISLLDDILTRYFLYLYRFVFSVMNGF